MQKEVSIPTIKVETKQIIEAVKQLDPMEKYKVLRSIGGDLTRVTNRIRAESVRLGLRKLSESQISRFIHQVRKQRG